MSAVLVRDGCLNCKNIWRYVEFGKCGCSDVEKSEITTKGLNEFLRRNGGLTEIKKPSYTLKDVEIPLKRVLETANKLASESMALATLTKGINEKAQKRNRSIKIQKSRNKVTIAVSGVRLSQSQLSWARRHALKKSDETVVLGVLNGSVKSGEIQGWIEKKAGVR